MSRTLVRESQLASYMQVLKTTDEYAIIRNNKTGTISIRLHTGSENFKSYNKQVDIAIAISKFPSEKLKEIAYTEDLKTEWSLERMFSHHVGLCFLLSSFEVEAYSYEEYTDNDLVLELVENWAGRYLYLQKIIEKSFPYLKTSIPDCPKTPEDLFLKIVEEERTRAFEAKIIQEYLEYDPAKLGKYFEEMSKPSADMDWDLAEKLAPRHNPTPSHNLLGKVIRITEDLMLSNPKKHSALRRFAEKYEMNTSHMFETAAEMLLQTRTNKGKLASTIVFNHGNIRYFSHGRERNI